MISSALRRIQLPLIAIALIGCGDGIDTTEQPLLNRLPASQTNIDFVNQVENGEDLNIFSYRNFYNGGGVGIGDINNDDLPDIFLTSNMGANKLYLNKGDLTFEDISGSAGIELPDFWSTGVSMVDINADGWLDVYVSNAGYRQDAGQENALFINNGDLTFTESAADYGLDDPGYTTHAVFFDYDLDGDLDAYILNNSFIPVNTLNYSNKRDLRARDWPVQDFLKGGGDRLLRNDANRFVDVSEEAGIYGSLIGFGLGITVGDVNGDYWPDLYISNDFFERDYLYINQQDGTFSEELESWFGHTSLSSMGADLGDINNDERPDLFVTDMLPGDDYRLKTTTAFESANVFRLKQERGFHNQFMQNSLQLNTGNNTFLEIAHHAGVAASDWSWGALMFDADLDGWTDIFVANGVFHDVTDQDFIDYFADEVVQRMVMTGEKEEVESVIGRMPSKPVVNKFFWNQRNSTFADMGEEWGLNEPSFSNGAAYGDLDRDGDLDLVVNNVNEPVMVYENTSSSTGASVSIRLTGEGGNTGALGSSILVYTSRLRAHRYHMPMRGFQSSVDPVHTIGIGEGPVDSIVVHWSDRSWTTVTDVGDVVEISKESSSTSTAQRVPRLYVKPQPNVELVGELAPHREDDFVDFDYERNIPFSLAQEGPAAATGDMDGDGSTDLYIGGATGQPGQLYLTNGDEYTLSSQPALVADAGFEDVAASMADFNGDGHPDLYVGSGGNDARSGPASLQDRLYLSNGTATLVKADEAVPPSYTNTSVAEPHDFDGDGDLDLFVGSRSLPNDYGPAPESRILVNKGDGSFFVAPASVSGAIARVGMVTDAIWVDLLGDEGKELVIVGDWMAPRIFAYDGSSFIERETILSHHSGWWQHVNAADVDGDGDQDLLVGGLGSNFFLRQTNIPVRMWISDFDNNGTTDKILTRNVRERLDVPVPMKRDLAQQIPSLKKDNVRHAEYASKSIRDLFPPEAIRDAQTLEVRSLSSRVIINEGNGQLESYSNPAMDLSSLEASLFIDLEGDDRPELMTGGNRFELLPQFSRLDASEGTVWTDPGPVYDKRPAGSSGLQADGEIKHILRVNSHVVFVRNNDTHQIYQILAGG